MSKESEAKRRVKAKNVAGRRKGNKKAKKDTSSRRLELDRMIEGQTTDSNN